MEKDNSYSLFPDESDQEPKKSQNNFEYLYFNKDLAVFLTSELKYNIGPRQLVHILENLKILDCLNLPTNGIPSDCYRIGTSSKGCPARFYNYVQWTEAGVSFIFEVLKNHTFEEIMSHKKKPSCLRSF